MTFLEHLEELRRRFIVCLVAVAIGFGISFTFAQDILHLLAQPILNLLPHYHGEMIFTGLTEPFFLYLKIALAAGGFLASPVIFFEFWAFISPGLRPEEKRYALPFIVFTSFFFLAGALFGYFVIFPVAFKYFLSLSTSFFSPKISLKEFLSFAFRVLLGFGLVFELPVLSTLLARLGVIDDRFLRRYRRYAVVIMFVVAAILTPGPDPLSQLLLAGPLLLLYELSILLAWIFKRR